MPLQAENTDSLLVLLPEGGGERLELHFQVAGAEESRHQGVADGAVAGRRSQAPEIGVDGGGGNTLYIRLPPNLLIN